MKRKIGGASAVLAAAIVVFSLPVSAAYTQFESIKSDGNIWVFSGYYPQCTDRVEVEFTAHGTSTAALYCSRGTDTGKSTFTAFLLNTSSGLKIRLDRNTTVTGPYSPVVTYGSGQHHTLVADGATLACTYDGNTMSETMASGTFTPASAFSIFGSHTRGSTLSESIGLDAISNRAALTLYSFKVYSADDELMLDLVPARDDDAKAGTTAQYGLYDRVARVFHKGLGTGKFTAGKQVGETGALGDDDYHFLTTVSSKTYLTSGSNANKVQFNDETPAADLTAWNSVATPGTLTPVPDSNHEFVTWGGDTNGLDIAADGTVSLDDNRRHRRIYCFFKAKVEPANVRRWTGGGATTDWTDTKNWADETLPAAGDTVVIPDHAEAVVNGSTTFATLNDLAGISMEGDASVLCISNLATAVSMSVPLSGMGVFSSKNQVKTTGDDSYHPLIINADNSNFAGIYSITNAGLEVKHANALGGMYGGALHIKTAGKQRLATSGGQTYYNDVFITGNGYGSTLFITYNGGVWKGDVHIYGGLSFHANTDHWTFRIDGDVTFERNVGVTYCSGGHVRFMGKVTNSYTASQYGGSELGGAPYSKNLGSLYLSSTVKCLAANVFVAGYSGFNFGNNNHAGALDLNGFDQEIGYCRVYNTAGYIKSATPATLTLTSSPAANFLNQAVDVFSGSVSLCQRVAGMAATTWNEVKTMNCTTDGGVLCENGNLRITETATFSNLTSLVAFKTGNFEINSVGINPVNGLQSLAVTNTAKMAFTTNMVQKTVRAYLDSTAQLKIGAGSYVKVSKRTFVDGVALAPGVYGKVGGKYADGSDIPAKYQKAWLTGDGWLETKGPRGLVVVIK